MANYYQSSPFPPPRLCFFLLIIVFLLGFSWYVNYEPVVKSVVGRGKLMLMVSPLILPLVVHWLSNNQSIISLPYLLPWPAKDSLPRAGRTPWGVGFLLAFLLIMLSYKSAFQERWFPLLSR